MKQIVNVYNRNKKIISIVLALISSMFININLDKQMKFIESIQGNTIYSLLFFVAFFVLIDKAISMKDKRMDIIAILLSLLLSICEVVGYSLDHYLDLSGVLLNGEIAVKCMVKTVALSIVIYSIIKIIYNALQSFHEVDLKTYDLFTFNRKSFIFLWGLIFLCWLPYLLCFFPGNLTPDSMSQICQGLGLTKVTNHHPVFHTALVSMTMNVGKILGNYNMGVAVYSVIQMLIMSAIFSYTVCYMAKKNIHIIIRILSVIFYALYPVHALYGMTMWKDILFAGVMLLLTITICEIVTDEHNFFQKRKNVVLFIVNMVLVFLLRNNGIYVILLLAPFFIIGNKGKWKQLTAAFAAVFVLYAIVNGPIFKIMNIQKGSVREALSIPLQQLARVTKYHGNELTEYEKETIHKFLPVDNLGEKYYERISDNVKNHFNDKEFTNNKLEFLKVWIELGIKHPKTYLESFLCGSYGYWYPEATHWVVSHTIIKPRNEVQQSLNIQQSPIKQFNILEEISDNIRDRTIPIYSMIYSIGMAVWVFITMLGYSIYKREYKLCFIYLPILFLWLTCLASPVFCEFRYIYSLFVSIPVLIGIHVRKTEGIDKKE